MDNVVDGGLVGVEDKDRWIRKLHLKAWSHGVYCIPELRGREPFH